MGRRTIQEGTIEGNVADIPSTEDWNREFRPKYRVEYFGTHKKVVEKPVAKERTCPNCKDWANWFREIRWCPECKQ